MSNAIVKSIRRAVAPLLLCAAGTVGAAGVPEDVSEAVADILPAGSYGEIASTPVDNLYKVPVGGGGFLFVTGDGQYLISGEMYQQTDGELVNLSENDRKGMRRKLIAQVDVADMIVFPAEGKRKAVINVFTDVDCGYCRKLHQDVPELNSRGVEVRYLAFPRAGIASPSYVKIATAWCDSDPQKALTDLKSGRELEANVCEDNPVAAEYQLGVDMGIQGTPAIVLMDGTIIPGYQPPDKLLENLGI